MPNQNYAQVSDLIGQGKLHWATDSILAILVTDAAFVASDKTMADLEADIRAVAPIQGRSISPENYGLGEPVAFPKVSAGVEHQVVIAQDTGTNNPVLLAFIDDDANTEALTVARSGTLIVRPVLQDEANPDASPTIGVWMRLGA